MLFNNGMYQEVVNVVQRRRDEQLKNGKSTSRHQNCLLFAACYKLVSMLYSCSCFEMFNIDFTSIFYYIEYTQRLRICA